MSKSTNILALDTAGASCSVAVWAAGGVRAEDGEAMARGQSERLVPMMAQVMAGAGLDYGDLAAIAVTLGPGGFTGVRLGLAAAQGLSIALDLPLIGLSNFEVLASSLSQVPPGRLPVAAIESKRAEVYIQVFGPSGPGAGLKAVTAGAAVLAVDLDRTLPPGALILVGDGAPRALEALRAAGRDAVLAPDPGPGIAALAARLAAKRPLPGKSRALPRPIYLRGPDVTLPGGRRIQAPDKPPGKSQAEA